MDKNNYIRQSFSFMPSDPRKLDKWNIQID